MRGAMLADTLAFNYDISPLLEDSLGIPSEIVFSGITAVTGVATRSALSWGSIAGR